MAKLILLLLLSRQYQPPSQMVDVYGPIVEVANPQVAPGDPRRYGAGARNRSEGKITK